MASFLLQQCRFRDGWLVPKKGESPVEVDWKGLCERLAPSRSMQARMNLRRISPNTYVGLLRQANGSTTNFVLRNLDLSGDVRGLAKANPLFDRMLVAAYRVDRVAWDDRMIEATKSQPERV